MNQKYCTGCNQLKDYSAFDMNGPRLRSQCRTCRNRANTQRVNRKALRQASEQPAPEWSMLGPHWPRAANGLLVPLGFGAPEPLEDVYDR